MNMIRIPPAVPRMFILGALTAVVLAASVPIPAQAASPKPGPELQPMEIWAGDWTYEVETKETPLGPGGRSVGTQSARWVLNGFFLDFRWRENGPQGNLGAVEMDWYDPATKSFAWQGYMDNGDIYTCTATASGKVWKSIGTQIHNGIPYKVRGETTFTADASAGTWRIEMSTDGKKWVPWVEGKMKKVSTSESTVEQEIVRLENAWAATSVSRDVNALAALLADDITSGNAEGKWYTKAEILADLKSGEYAATSAASDDMKVRVYGDIAVVTGRTTEKSQLKGVDSSGQYIWTDTWQKRDGAWVCIATHGSKIGTKIGP
jgi:ketosteroid isomerase-like protein